MPALCGWRRRLGLHRGLSFLILRECHARLVGATEALIGLRQLIVRRAVALAGRRPRPRPPGAAAPRRHRPSAGARGQATRARRWPRVDRPRQPSDTAAPPRPVALAAAHRHRKTPDPSEPSWRVPLDAPAGAALPPGFWIHRAPRPVPPQSHDRPASTPARPSVRPQPRWDAPDRDGPTRARRALRRTPAASRASQRPRWPARYRRASPNRAKARRHDPR